MGYISLCSEIRAHLDCPFAQTPNIIKPNRWSCSNIEPNTKLNKIIRYYSRKYENTLGDVNVEPDETNMKAFCNQYKLQALNKEHTWFKNVDNHLVFTYSFKMFWRFFTLETGLTDYHKFIITVTKTKHKRFLTKIIKYRDYKNFDTKVFKKRL